jgi:hypothetical protein
MAHLHRSCASFRIGGDDLDPAALTTSLGAAPSQAQTKGDKIVGKTTGHVRVAKTGMWLLEATEREPADLDGQILEVLGKMTDDIDVWRMLTSKYRADIFCGLFMKGTDEGFTISPKTLAALGTRGIELGICLYAPLPEDAQAPL